MSAAAAADAARKNRKWNLSAKADEVISADDLVIARADGREKVRCCC